MPVEMGLWRIDDGEPRRLTASMLPTEVMLEEFLEKDPSLLGEALLVIGRQVKTPHGKFIDLLAIDSEGDLHVLELKRDKTPRDVVAQTLDYGSWVTTLHRDEVITLANQHLDRSFEVAFEETFGAAPPDEINENLTMTIVATDLDNSSERIVTYLRTFGVPIDAVFFSYLVDADRHYLARSWLASSGDGGTGARTDRTGHGKRAEWNGHDWFVSFGEPPGGRSWADGRRWGFVAAGGDPWYSRTLRSVPEGARVNVHLPQKGYVAVGETLGPAQRFEHATVLVDGRWERLADQRLEGGYTHGGPGEQETPENAEYVIPVRWLHAVPAEEAYWEKGMFANQNSACKLRQTFTLERLATHFQVDEEIDD